MTNQETFYRSQQLAKLFIDLAEMRNKINAEILPACAHLAPEETGEIVQAIELAASAIEQHLAKYRLVAEPIKQ